MNEKEETLQEHPKPIIFLQEIYRSKLTETRTNYQTNLIIRKTLKRNIIRTINDKQEIIEETESITPLNNYHPNPEVPGGKNSS